MPKGKPRERYVYINVYELDQGYGGPEEGGWYFETGTPRLTIRHENVTRFQDRSNPWFWQKNGEPNERMTMVGATLVPNATLDECKRLRDALQDIFPDNGNRYNVRPQDEDFAVVIEDHPARAYPVNRPYYD